MSNSSTAAHYAEMASIRPITSRPGIDPAAVAAAAAAAAATTTATPGRADRLAELRARKKAREAEEEREEREQAARAQMEAAVETSSRLVNFDAPVLEDDDEEEAAAAGSEIEEEEEEEEEDRAPPAKKQKQQPHPPPQPVRSSSSKAAALELAVREASQKAAKLAGDAYEKQQKLKLMKKNKNKKSAPVHNEDDEEEDEEDEAEVQQDAMDDEAGEEDEEAEEAPTAAYTTTTTTKKKFKVPAAAASAATTTTTTKRAVGTIVRNPKWSAANEGPVIGEQFMRDGVLFEVITVPEFTPARMNYVRPEAGKITPDWNAPNASLDACFDAYDVSGDKNDTRIRETFVQTSRTEFYAVSQNGANILIKRKPNTSTPKTMREFRAMVRKSDNLQYVGRTPRCGPRSYIPWCIHNGRDSHVAATVAAGGRKRKTPASGAAAAAAAAASITDVPPLFIEKVNEYVNGELATHCRSGNSPAEGPCRLTLRMNKFKNMWSESSDLEAADGAVFGVYAKYKNSKYKTRDECVDKAAAEGVRMMIHAFLMTSPVGAKMIADLQATLTKEGEAAVEDNGDD